MKVVLGFGAVALSACGRKELGADALSQCVESEEIGGCSG